MLSRKRAYDILNITDDVDMLARSLAADMKIIPDVSQLNNRP
jgi:hypothetical protein